MHRRSALLLIGNRRTRRRAEEFLDQAVPQFGEPRGVHRAQKGERGVGHGSATGNRRARQQQQAASNLCEERVEGSTAVKLGGSHLRGGRPRGLTTLARWPAGGRMRRPMQLTSHFAQDNEQRTSAQQQRAGVIHQPVDRLEAARQHDGRRR